MNNLNNLQGARKGYNVLLCPSNNLFIPTVVLMINISRICKENIYFYIMESDWEDELKNSAYEIMSSYDNAIVEFVTVDNNVFSHLSPWRGFYQCYYYLIAHMLIPSYVERVLYLDVDTLVLGDFQTLYDMDFAGNYFIAGEDEWGLKQSNFAVRSNKHQLQSFFNSGVLMINLAMFRENNIDINYYLHQIDLMPDKDFAADQGLINFAFWDKVKLVPGYIWNHCIHNLSTYLMISSGKLLNDPTQCTKVYSIIADRITEYDPVIVHFTGPGVFLKTWNVFFDGNNNLYCNFKDHRTPEEIKRLSELYHIWWSYAKELPCELYLKLLLNAVEFQYKNLKNENAYPLNAFKFLKSLVLDMLDNNYFIQNILKMKTLGLKIAVLKSTDAAGEILLKTLAKYKVEVFFSHPTWNCAYLTDGELDMYKKADIIIRADVHTPKPAAKYGEKIIGINELLEGLVL